MSRSGAKAASLPSRAPFFTRANNPINPMSMDETMPITRGGTPFPESASCSDVDMDIDIDIVDVQSTSRLSYNDADNDNESDMSGLLVGNIAVDGSRDCKLREIAAKAEGSAVASWFTGIIAPPTAEEENEGEQGGDTIGNTNNTNTSTLRRRARSSQRDLSAPDGYGYVGYPASDGTCIRAELFDELCTSLAIVLNAVSVSAALEREDMTVAMDDVAADVARSSSTFVMRMHEKALEIVKSNKLGIGGGINNMANVNPTALVQQVQSLQGEVTSLRSDVVMLRSQLAAIEDNWKRFRWPLRSFPRSLAQQENHTAVEAGTMPYSVKRASAV